jgi:myo-inositol 2-dehydrogenase / D-chiro-inositol 1-dehydrogenase
VSDVFRIGLVGGGRMGRTHIRAISSSPHVSIVAVAEPHEETAAKLRDTGFTVHPDHASLLGAGGVDGVLVAAPTDQHLTIVADIVKAGLPILSEKPCGLNADQAREAGAVAARHGVPLQVAYWRRFVPALQELQRKIAGDDMGELHFTICAQWDEAPPATQFRAHSGGIFVDMGVHEIDQIRWLTGQEIVDATVASFPMVEDPDVVGDADSSQALLTLSGGGTALVSLGRFYPGGDMVAVEVFGSRDHARVGVLEPSTGEGPQLEALRRQAEAFARWAEGGSREGASIDDAEVALVVANQLSDKAGLRVLGQEA